MIQRIILEGVDRCGKSTIASMLEKELKSSNVKIMHFTGPPNELTQKENFIESLDTINNFANKSPNNLYITDRDIYGEVVYGATYRKEDPNWIWELEHEYYMLTKNSLFILLEDTAKNSLKRDDGKSYTTNRFKRYKEILKFRKAFKKSIILHKHIISIEGKTPNEVLDEIISDLYKANIERN